MPFLFSTHLWKFGRPIMPLNAIFKFGLSIPKEIIGHNWLFPRVKGVWEVIILRFYPCRCNIFYECKALSASRSVMSNNHLEKSTKWDPSHPHPTWMVLDSNLEILFYFQRNMLQSIEINNSTKISSFGVMI